MNIIEILQKVRKEDKINNNNILIFNIYKAYNYLDFNIMQNILKKENAMLLKQINFMLTFMSRSLEFVFIIFEVPNVSIN